MKKRSPTFSFFQPFWWQIGRSSGRATHPAGLKQKYFGCIILGLLFTLQVVMAHEIKKEREKIYGFGEEVSGHFSSIRAFFLPFFYDSCFQTTPFFFVICYILTSGGFTQVQRVILQDHREWCRRVSMHWTDTYTLKFPQLDDLFHTLEIMEGLLYLVPSRTPRNSWCGVLYTWGLCYMLFLLYVI